MLNTIFKVNHNSHVEVQGTGQQTIKALRNQLPNRFPHIVLVAFKNPNTGELIYPKLEVTKKNYKKAEA